MKRNVRKLAKMIVYATMLAAAYYVFNALREFSANISRKLDSIESLSAARQNKTKFENASELKSLMKDGGDERAALPWQNNHRNTKRPSFKQEKTDPPSLTDSLPDPGKRRSESSEFPRKMESDRSPANHSSTTKRPRKKLKSEMYLNETYVSERTSYYLHLMSRASVVYMEGFYSYPVMGTYRVFYRKAKTTLSSKTNSTVFLLHGRTFDSRIWLSIGTMYELPNYGFDVIAVQLPGYGQSENATELDVAGDRANLLTALMGALAPVGKRFLVAPGDAGAYAVPMMMTSQRSFLSGVVLISPSFTSKYEVKRYSELNMAVLVFYGQDDSSMLPFSSMDSLEHLKEKRVYVLNDAGKDCYVDQPMAFHRLLKRFLFRATDNKKVKKQ